MFTCAFDGADLELRDEAGGDGWTVRGIAVPWATPTRIDATLTEEFVRGAFAAQAPHANRVMLARGHMPQGGALIGRLSMMRDDAAGLYVEGRISATDVGRDTRTLIADGVLDRFSIGFREGRNRRSAGVIQRVTADLREVAIVPNPAYADAVITGLREGCAECLARAAAPESAVPDVAEPESPVRSRALEAARLQARYRPLPL